MFTSRRALPKTGRILHRKGSSLVQIEATTDRKQALEGADQVIITIVSDGFVPRKLNSQ